MNIKPSELVDQGFILQDKLDHKELIPFIRTYINKRTKYSTFFTASNLFIFALSGYLLMRGFNKADYSFGGRLIYFSFGLVIAFALTPLHEFIHVLAYKSQGATNTSYAANFRKFYFMALADKFVANKKEFTVVGLAPFVVISGVLVVLLFLVNANWTMTVAGTLLTHTAMCSGDFGLLSYFEFHKTKTPVTFDDVEEKVSYFYVKEDLNSN